MSEKGNEIAERQAKLREIQRKRDNGNTFGHESKEPCKPERELSIQCLELTKENENINCKDYFENYKTCKKFWNTVQEYRVRYLKKPRFEYPKDEEYEKWKAKLPEFLSTNKVTPPDDI